MSKKKKVIFIISAILLILIIVTIILLIVENKLRRAEYFEDEFRFDGLIYREVDYREIEPYDETYSAVCKTTDGAWILYEIKQYPNHEYLVARCGWEARVVKLS